jgi:hypothetical protein
MTEYGIEVDKNGNPTMHVNPETTPFAERAVSNALHKIHNRSFSDRHPELGKMINCVHCDLRHRESERNCQQQFAHRWIVVDGEKVYTDEQLIAGKTPETETVLIEKKLRLFVGAKPFKGKRKNPPLNKRQNLFVQLVHSLVPNEYTQEDLRKARTQAKFILARDYGRHGFMKPEWLSRKEANAKKNQAVDGSKTVQTSEANISNS